MQCKPGGGKAGLHELLRALIVAAALSGPVDWVPPLFGAPSPGSTGVATGPVPAWVQWQTPANPATNDQHSLPGGQSYALLDRQVSIGGRKTFLRVVKDIVNETGVQSGANLSFAFDPSFQELRLHHIAVERGGQRSDRLELARIKVIQQESDLDRQIYNGMLSALVFLNDIRPGDRIDYAYTVSGANPVLQGRYADSFLIGLAVPLQRLHLRLLVPDGRMLFHKTVGQTVGPAFRRRGNEQEYTWTLLDQPAVQIEDQVPSWVPMLPWIQCSDFPDWHAVAQWAAGLYVSTNLDSPEMTQCLASLRRPGREPAAEVLDALRFVQNDIRYLGIEFGPGSCQPTDPTVVLQRRFGDCKDKAFLLSALLQKLGHDAAPVLVATGFRQAAGELLPSPYVFDHVIVQTRIGIRDYWLDPTRSYQRGGLDERFVPDYGRGLRIRPNETALTPVFASAAGNPETITLETFSIGGQKEPTKMDVTTTFSGFDAEWIRASLASRGRDELAKSWLNDYSQRYPDIAPAGDLAITDPTNRDVVTIAHSYAITNFWRLTENRQVCVGLLYPQGIAPWIVKPSAARRAQPLGMAFPRHRAVRTIVHLPADWPVTNFTRIIESPAAHLELRRTYSARTLVLDYDYRALASEVPVDRLGDHLRALDEMDKVLGYTLSWQNQDSVRGDSRFNWPVFSVAAIYVLLLGVVVVVAYARFIRARGIDPAMLPPALEPHLGGLRGWLILVGIGLFTLPFLTVARLVKAMPSYAPLKWQALTAPGGIAYQPLWGPVLVFELLAQLTILALGLFTLVLFLQKRRLFPRCYIALLLVSAVIVVLDNTASHFLSLSSSPASRIEFVRELTRAVVACAVWIPYMLVSKRVKATFLR